MVLVGFLSVRGYFDRGTALVFAILGGIVGDMVSYNWETREGFRRER